MFLFPKLIKKCLTKLKSEIVMKWYEIKIEIKILMKLIDMNS
jgi:hypothetical protein